LKQSNLTVTVSNGTQVELEEPLVEGDELVGRVIGGAVIAVVSGRGEEA